MQHLEWEQKMSEKDRAEEQERRDREMRQQTEEEEEVRRMRAEAVHRAKPVPHYKLFAVQNSTEPLTMPESPHFSERLRARAARK